MKRSSYLRRQSNLIISMIIFVIFLIVDINVLINKHQVVPVLLSSISLIIFIMLFVVALFKCITNYKHQS
ncbi:hypothetical protein PZJ14_08760 [Staphylococcus epidermidis]|jgi:predicted neutral ceramidase superfamily lipid hydrolase|uniref:Uncharacterized protein n=4 Tax=root TaxID=1 RepID=Q5HRK0_STAEQ|nr:MULTISPECIES: hypothetical protein [Staphylococcus]EHQ78707.1 hypothetical protein SEVCU057_1288 [Staphylococcus epidermidis VCU057]EJD78342.1 hypothetical protein HMPREF9994_11358 [Staphylococcus epidermidis NIHLM088]EJD82581.1 hypothetical protein HMPREF9992_11789 [Staphylococcus epidermidis NIHLM070]EON82102.1 hypothetical protein H700_05694 [Staphylococcus epidermidis 41tr]EON82716.1 hypothetical protein H701_06435 [Staphylococcus epidermidis 528m]EON86199.1 hypothetical protein D592_0